MLSSELVRSVLDSAPDAMIIIDGNGRILFANHQVTTLFGHPLDSIVGQPVEALLPERFRDRHVGHRRSYAESLRLRPMGIGLDLFARRKDGSEFPVEISLSPIRAGEAMLVAAAIRDVTDRMQAQRELKDAHAAADRANQAKSRFLATASHDLRQPLQTLALLNGAMRRLSADTEVLEALEHQDQAISAMSRLLNALLDISKLESGAIKPEITDFKVAALLEELRTEFANLAHTKGLELAIEPCSECAHSDPALVGQVLRNLVSNAIKYTQHGFVQIRAHRTDDRVRIEIADSGVGIAPNELTHIYDEFYQVGVSTNASRDGYGLGLSIVQRVVKLLDAGIDVVSQLGKGSTFSLVLPACVAGAGPALRPLRRSSDSAPSPAAQRHVLLVEDDPGVRNATRLFLKVAGYRVAVAATLAEALEHTRHTRDIDLLVTDYHLDEGHTGLEVIAALREELGVDLGAILVTGDTSSAVRELHRDARLRLASKPIDSEELLGVMADLLAAR